MKLFYSIFILFSMTILTLFCAEPSLKGQTAVLIEGTVPSAGLPGFSANRIEAMHGRYETDGKVSVEVWATLEPLLFNPETWVAKNAGPYFCHYTVSAENRQIWIVQRTVTMRKELADQARWWFIASFERLVSEDDCVLFLDAYIKRTEFFFSSAKRVSDLSFPATLTITGKN